MSAESIELIRAVTSRNFPEIDRLLREGKANINFLPDWETYTTHKQRGEFLFPPIWVAGEAKDAEMIEFLIKLQSRYKLKPLDVNILRNHGYDRNILLHMIEDYSYHYGGQRPVDQINRDKKLITLLLSMGSDMLKKGSDGQGSTIDIALLPEFRELAQLCLYEALLRPQVDIIHRILNKTGLKVEPEELIRYLQLVPRKKLPEVQMQLVHAAIDALVREQKIGAEKATRLKQIIEDPDMYTLGEMEMPECLKPQLQRRTEINRTSLEEIIANMQNCRGRLTEAGTNETLLRFGTYTKEFLEERSKQYSVDKLIEFLDPKPKQRYLATLELQMYEGVVLCICEAALHEKLDQVHRDRCVALLANFESLTPEEKRAADVGKIITSNLEAAIARLNSDTANAVVTELRKESDEQKKEIQRLHKELNTTREELNTTRTKLEAKLDAILELLKPKPDSGYSPAMFSK